MEPVAVQSSAKYDVFAFAVARAKTYSQYAFSVTGEA
jgi:hypothetical protein